VSVAVRLIVAAPLAVIFSKTHKMKTQYPQKMPLAKSDSALPKPLLKPMFSI